MRNTFRRNRCLTLGLALNPVVVVAGFASAGFGHGDYVVARCLLPFACAAGGRYVGAGLVISVLALTQWPFYGLVVDRASRKAMVGCALVLVHGGLCVWLFTRGAEGFE